MSAVLITNDTDYKSLEDGNCGIDEGEDVVMQSGDLCMRNVKVLENGDEKI